jgi:hypothetical protein
MKDSNERLLRRADAFLAKMSWDTTYLAMESLMDRAASADELRVSSAQGYASFDEDEAREVG